MPFKAVLPTGKNLSQTVDMTQGHENQHADLEADGPLYTLGGRLQVRENF